MDAQDKPPEVRAKRPVYRSYGELIRVLITDANNRVKADKRHEIPKPEITAPMRALAKTVLGLRKVLKAKERQLVDEYKVHVPDRCEREDQAVPIEWTYSEQNRLRDQRPAEMQARLDAIKRWRVRATLDTIDLTPRQAKAYLLKLEQQLAKI